MGLGTLIDGRSRVTPIASHFSLRLLVSSHPYREPHALKADALQPVQIHRSGLSKSKEFDEYGE